MYASWLHILFQIFMSHILFPHKNTEPRHSSPLILPQDVMLEENAALLRKLWEQMWMDMVREQILSFITHVEPEILIGVKRWHLRLVVSDAQREVETLLGIQIHTLAHTSQTSGLILWNTKEDIVKYTHIPDMKHMTQKEFELLVSSYFSDPQTRNFIIGLFYRERWNIEANLWLDLTQIGNKEEIDIPTNTHTLGTTETQDPLLTVLQSWWSWERKRRFSYHYSFAKVRRMHSGMLSNFFPLRLTKTLLSHLWLRKSEIIDFPEKDIPARTSQIDSQDASDLSWKLPADTAEICEKVFITLSLQLAQQVENIEWLTGVRQELYIPEILAPQLNRLKELEVLAGLYNFHAHLESSVLTAMVYLYPELAGQHAVKKAAYLTKIPWERYPDPREVFISQPKTVQQEMDALKQKEGIYLEMDERVANLYGFGEHRGIRCSLALLEQIWKIPDEENIIFEIAGKQAQLSAKMFRRVFHRGIPPERGVETGEIIVGDFTSQS